MRDKSVFLIILTTGDANKHERNEKRGKRTRAKQTRATMTQDAKSPTLSVGFLDELNRLQNHVISHASLGERNDLLRSHHGIFRNKLYKTRQEVTALITNPFFKNILHFGKYTRWATTDESKVYKWLAIGEVYKNYQLVDFARAVGDVTSPGLTMGDEKSNYLSNFIPDSLPIALSAAQIAGLIWMVDEFACRHGHPHLEELKLINVENIIPLCHSGAGRYCRAAQILYRFFDRHELTYLECPLADHF
jgi:hypothetical protein